MEMAKKVQREVSEYIEDYQKIRIAPNWIAKQLTIEEAKSNA